MSGIKNMRGVAQGRRSVGEERGSAADGQRGASEKRLSEKWLSVLCAGMAIFGVGVMLVGYKSPTVGLVATVALLVIASSLLAMKAKANVRE